MLSLHVPVHHTAAHRKTFSSKQVSMAISLMKFVTIKHQKRPSCIIFFLGFFTTMQFVGSQDSNTTDCIIDFQFSSSNIDSNCTSGNWGGFLANNCCGSAFDGYLYALAKNANQTGQIFLNSTQQQNCLDSAKSIDRNLSSCGIEKLASGGGGCSDYSVMDAVNYLGNKLRNLDEDCKLLGLDGGFDSKGCNACLRSWREMGGSSNNSKVSGNSESDICRFAGLVAMTSQRINDQKWIQGVYKCLGEENLSLDHHRGKVKHIIKFGTVHWILVGAITGIVLIIFIAFWILFKKIRKRKLPKGKDVSNDSITEDYSSREITIKEVYSATDNLCVSNFIGQGIAGKVYKGVLPNGQDVAVKHIINDGHMETFVREVTSLSHVRHPNLVALLGHYEGRDECFLVYELCHNGNLSEWLFGKDKSLSWIQRLEISIDCARGLWFLHTYPEGCIVHRDIKPTNILICKNFQGKLSDFGLSKIIEVGRSHVSSEVRGTFGYVDPEYQKNHRVNSSGDVYSFGIVLLQLLSGQRVLNLDLTMPMPLHKRAKMLTKGGSLKEFADPRLKEEYSFEAFGMILKLAVWCTGPKQQRPSMEQVVARLERALDISTKVVSFSPHFKQDVP